MEEKEKKLRIQFINIQRRYTAAAAITTAHTHKHKNLTSKIIEKILNRNLDNK